MMALSYYYACKLNLPVEQKFSLPQVGKATVHAFWALSIPLVIWGGIFLGIATARKNAQHQDFCVRMPLADELNDRFRARKNLLWRVRVSEVSVVGIVGADQQHHHFG